MKDIKGFENYSVTENGRVWSKPRVIMCGPGCKSSKKVGGKWLKGKIDFGYNRVGLYDASRKVYFRRVNRLVAQAYVPNPDNLPEVNHIDGDKLNDNASNLEWTTRNGNALHSTRVLKKNRRGNHALAKLNDEKVAEIRQKLSTGTYEQRELAKEYGVSQRTIWNILHNISWNDAIK